MKIPEIKYWRVVAIHLPDGNCGFDYSCEEWADDYPYIPGTKINDFDMPIPYNCQFHYTDYDNNPIPPEIVEMTEDGKEIWVEFDY